MLACFSLHSAVVSQLLFSEIVLDVLLRLLNKEVSDHSRHLQQYFQVFLAYAHKGPLEVSMCDMRVKEKVLGLSNSNMFTIVIIHLF